MRARREERGSAMLWAMGLLVIAGSLTALFVERDRTLRREVVFDATARQALHAVDGGLAQVRHTLMRDPAYRGETLTLGAVEVKTVVRRTAPDAWTVEVRVPGRGRGIRATLRATPGLPRVASRSAL